jgi:hypothetical protein
MEDQVGGVLGICTRPTMNLLLLLRTTHICMSGGLLRTSTRSTLNLLLLLRASVRTFTLKVLHAPISDRACAQRPSCQVAPKACGHTRSRRVIPRADAVSRVRAACDERDEAGYIDIRHLTVNMIFSASGSSFVPHVLIGRPLCLIPAVLLAVVLPSHRRKRRHVCMSIHHEGKSCSDLIRVFLTTTLRRGAWRGPGGIRAQRRAQWGVAGGGAVVGTDRWCLSRH